MNKVTYFLDELILPIVILVSTRYFGVFISQYWYSITFSFNEGTDIISLPYIHFAGPAGRFTANSASWLIVGIVISLYFGLTIFRSLHFHKDYFHPKHAWYVHGKNLEFLLIDKKDVLYQSAVWITLSLLFVFLATIDVFSGTLDIFVYGLLFGIVTVAILTSLFYNMSQGALKSRKVEQKNRD